MRRNNNNARNWVRRMSIEEGHSATLIHAELQSRMAGRRNQVYSKITFFTATHHILGQIDGPEAHSASGVRNIMVDQLNLVGSREPLTVDHSEQHWLTRIRGQEWQARLTDQANFLNNRNRLSYVVIDLTSVPNAVCPNCNLVLNHFSERIAEFAPRDVKILIRISSMEHFPGSATSQNAVESFDINQLPRITIIQQVPGLTARRMEEISRNNQLDARAMRAARRAQQNQNLQ